MKKIKTINKLLSSLTLLSPLAGIGFNNQYQDTQKVITENDSAPNGYFNLVGDQRLMGEITVTVEGTAITGYVSGEGNLVVDSDITEIRGGAFSANKNITSLDLTQATSLTTIRRYAFSTCSGLNDTNLIFPSTFGSISSEIDYEAFSQINFKNIVFLCDSLPRIPWISCVQGPTFEIPSESFYVKNTQEFMQLILGMYELFGTNESEVSSHTIQYSFDGETLSDINGTFKYDILPTTTSNSSEFEWTNWEPYDMDIDFGVWTLNPYGETQTVPQQITIDKGIVHWTNLPAGSYTFKVQCQIGNLIKESSNVLQINSYDMDQCSISGEKTIITANTIAGSSTYSISTNIQGIQVQSWRYWEQEPTIGTLKWLSINKNGELNWVPNTDSGEYTIYLEATISDEVKIVDSITLRMYGSTFNGDKEINTTFGQAGSSQYTFSSTPEGLKADLWEIEMVEGTKPDWLSIDNQGVLSWTDQCVEGTYKFKIKTTDTTLNISSESSEITLNVTSKETNSIIPMILGISIGLGIPIILAVGFGIWYLTKKKKTKVKI